VSDDDALHEVLRRLRDGAPGLRVRNGGTAIARATPPGATGFVDITPLALTHLREVDGTFTLGASLTLAQLAAAVSADMPKHHPLQILARTAPGTTHASTLAGAICTAPSASALACALLACDASVAINHISRFTRRAETRVVALNGFFAYRDKLLTQGVLISELRVPLPEPFDTAQAHLRASADGALCAVVHYARHKDEAVDLRVAVGGLGETPQRLSALEKAMMQAPLQARLPLALDHALAPFATHARVGEVRAMLSDMIV
jgi:CO/xanthine dehydrogenase FAD-binding subunit